MVVSVLYSGLGYTHFTNMWFTHQGPIYPPSSTPPGFPDSSVGKESSFNAGDSGSIPGLGRSAGEGIGKPLQYSWASLVAQLVKNPPAMKETWVRSLDWEDPLEKGKATHYHQSIINRVNNRRIGYKGWGLKMQRIPANISQSNDKSYKEMVRFCPVQCKEKKNQSLRFITHKIFP